jgi:hypothetical protein
VQTTLPNVKHQENAFSDFNVQGLLPNYLSRGGPCIEVADINKDGLQDFFMGGAKDRASQIFIQNINGTFTSKSESEIKKDSVSEEVAAAFFDAEN